jgi:hypothetical protein
MARLTRKTVILAKIETTAGTDAVPTGAANAIQVMDQTITPLEANNVDLNILLPYFGGSPQLVGTAYKKVSFSTLIAGSGTAATPPAWGALLQACGMAEATGLTAPNRVEYLPVTDILKTATIYYFDDGVLHKLVGAFGNVKLSAKVGEAPKWMYDFIGIDGGDTAVANPTAVLTAWKVPVAITKANVTDIQLGCTYATGALSGGTPYNSTGLTLDFGNKIDFVPMLTTEEVVLTERKVTGTVSLELTAAQEVAFMATVKANTLQGMGFVIGTATGNKIMIHKPSVQLINHKKEDINGKRIIGYDLRAVPVAGNDEVRFVCL